MYVALLQVDLQLTTMQHDALVATLRGRDRTMDLVARRHAQLAAAVQVATAADASDADHAALLQMVSVSCT